MYKKFFMGIAAIAALTLVSCSSDDLNSISDNSSKNEAISFDGYLGRSAVAVNGTRGSVETKDKLKTDGFGVFGTYSSTIGQASSVNLFENQKVAYSNDEAKWTYSPLKYWPTQGDIDFLAYAPYVDKKQLTGSSIEFTVEGEAANQKDLLWANAKDQTKANNSGAKKVEFTFNHALAKIGYSVKLNKVYPGTTITLNKITLAGSATDPTKEAFYTKGTIDLSKSTSDANLWTPSSSDAKQYFDWYSGTQSLTNTPAFNSTEYLFVIPQDFSQTTKGADELYVIVDYTIQHDTSKQTMTSSSKIEKNFLQGKAYTINLTIGLTPIEFNAEVNDWGNGDKIPDISWE